MLDFTSKFGRHVSRRLRQEKVIWLTTVDSHSTPQPRPVWFHWDGETVLIFSEKNKAKLRHIANNPNVSLNFNTDEDGGDVVVLVGNARILDELPDPNRVRTYLRKYTQGIKDLRMTVAQFTDSYSVPILVTPRAMRGFIE
ncbi:MAG TPA: TIGR03667 family PPOX class F420-dependent oxidoreductase [Candidatus Binatia bacterium]|jgi:PPOX class probable F420-dependent enzyme|nr:TIGR03667 family PPOX class F420-dependent oxidoreductase [Candidatus Binatia bacterium]